MIIVWSVLNFLHSSLWITFPNALNIIILFIWKFFISVLADGFPQESEW